MTLTPEQRDRMRREFLLETDLDGETRSKIYGVAAVLERIAEEEGDPDAHDVYLETCWTLSRPENLGEVDQLYRKAQPIIFEMLMDAEEGAPPPRRRSPETPARQDDEPPKRVDDDERPKPRRRPKTLDPYKAPLSDDEYLELTGISRTNMKELAEDLDVPYDATDDDPDVDGAP